MESKHFFIAFLVVSLMLTVQRFPAILIDTSEEPTDANITRVIDGDTVEIDIYGRQDTVRFVGIDAPEIHSENSPRYFENIPETEEAEQCLREWGFKAKEFVENQTEDREVVLKYDGDRRDQYGRLRSHIVIDEENLNFRMVEEGYATVFPIEFENRSEFEAAERTAREEKKNLWECTTLEG